MKRHIAQTLESIGLTKGEIEVYLALLELGLSTTGNITKHANISSSKVYEVLQRLINKGLASYVIQNGVHHYAATPAARLLDFMEQKKDEIQKGQNAIAALIPKLETQRVEQIAADAVIYRGKQGPLIALQETLTEGKKGAEILGYGTDEDDYLKHYPAQLKAYITEQAKSKIKMRLIFGEGFHSPNKGANIRYAPRGLTAPVRTIIYGNKVAIVDFNEPFTTIIIDKKGIADAYRTHFELLWKMTK
jgi:HTH-type transcriptional regulator, sugar sensing transcriptional regulator